MESSDNSSPYKYDKYGTIVLVSNEKEKRYTLDFDEGKEVLIGRHSMCNIVINLQCVSRKHAKIDHQNGNTCLTPITKNSNTYLNGELLTKTSSLFNGDIISIGGICFKYEFFDSKDQTIYKE